MGLIGPPHFSRSRREEEAALRAALARAVVPRGTGQVGGRVRLLGRPGESEGCARVSEGWLAKKVVAWAYEPITDSRISPPMHTRVLMISARVARESAKMHLRNMGCAWSSSMINSVNMFASNTSKPNLRSESFEYKAELLKIRGRNRTRAQSTPLNA